MNFLIEEGPEAFETECQCNVELKDEEGQEVKASIEEIIHKTSRFKRFECPADTQYITTHIDIGHHILTYVTMSSPQLLRPSVIDYGTWPSQPGAIWEKSKVVNTLSRHYPETPELENRIYLGVTDLLASLTEREYIREDGAAMLHNMITVDVGFRIDEVLRAIRDSSHRHIIFGARGQGLTARVKEFGQRHYGPDCIVYHHCALVPSLDRQTMILYMDVNYFKTMFHKGIKSRAGVVRSIDLFSLPQGKSHLQFAQHCTAESPFEDKNELEGRTVIIWSPPKGDNEYFDNTVGCLANFMKLGCKLSSSENKPKKKMDIQDYLNQQKQQ
jgi:hypothetical protein